MKKIYNFALAFGMLGASAPLFAQGVGINSTNSAPNASAMLDVSATNKGVLIPRIALTGTTDATTITTPTTSLIIYNSATVSDVTPGFYYWNGSRWVRLTSGADQGLWTENAGNLFPTTLSNNVGIGTITPNQKLHVKGISRFQRADANNYLEISADINGVYLTSDDPGNNQKPLYLDAKPSPTVTKPIYMRTDNITRMTVHGDGNVGIGTITPSHKLHVNAGTFTGASTTTGSKAFINHGSGSGTSSIVGFEGHARTNSWSATTEVIGLHGLGEYRFAAVFKPTEPFSVISA